MMPKAATSVSEKRFYYVGEKLTRVLAKDGKFPAGKKTDTSGLKNADVPLSEIEGASEHYATMRQEALARIAKLKRITDDSTPVAGNAPPGRTIAGNGWRAIAGSQSRDGRFALAWGLKGQTAPVGETAEDGTLSVDQEAQGLMNYLVDLHSGKIVGLIAGKHFGDKSGYNHTNSETSWSYGSTYVAQVNNGKWATFEAKVYQVTDGDAVSVSKGSDLVTPTKKAAFEHLKGSDRLKKFNKEAFALALHDVSIVRKGNDTVVVVGVTGEIPKSEEEGSSFDATITFKISSDDKGGAPVLTWSGTEVH